jgi:hypothetical protein
MTTIAAIKGIENLSGAELKALVKTAHNIGAEPDWLAAIIGLETNKTFSPKISNSKSGATGIIQWLPSTAKQMGIGSTKEEAIANLKKMSFTQQLKWVERYYKDYIFKGKPYTLKNLEDAYFVVFSPKGIGKSNDSVLYQAGTIEAEQNKGFANAEGVITRGAVTGGIRAVLRSAGDRRVTVPLFSTSTILLAGLAGYVYWKHKRHV